MTNITQGDQDSNLFDSSFFHQAEFFILLERKKKLREDQRFAEVTQQVWVSKDTRWGGSPTHSRKQVISHECVILEQGREWPSVSFKSWFPPGEEV